MRQLIIAAFLVIISMMGVYYLVTQKLNLNRYYPPDEIQLPDLRLPQPLASITPGPELHHLSGFAQTPTPKPLVSHASFTHSAPRSVPKPLPVTVTAPTAPAVTPLPAPVYHQVTPPPFVPSYPAPVIHLASPSPSPTHAPGAAIDFASPSPLPKFTPSPKSSP